MPIVCGTDFSQPASEAVRVASLLATKLGEELVLVHTVQPQPGDPMIGWDSSGLREAMGERLERETAALRAGGSAVRGILTTGWPDADLVEIASKEKASLLILGATGHRLGTHWLLGSIAERVAQKTARPLLLVRSARPLETWVRGETDLPVIVATDFSPVSDEAARQSALLGRAGNCRITLLHVAEQIGAAETFGVHGPIDPGTLPAAIQEPLLRRLRERAQKIEGMKTSVEIVPTLGSVAGAINRAAAQRDAALVVVGAHQRHGFSRMWQGSVAHGVLHGAPTNVLCVPAREATEQLVAPDAPVFRTILAATDLSPTGNAAVATAMGLAPDGSRVILFHVVTHPDAVEHARHELSRLHRPASWRKEVELVEEVAHENDAAEAIRTAAERHDADLIVVGSRGHKLLPGLGSVSRQLVADARRRVLVVPAEIRSA